MSRASLFTAGAAGALAALALAAPASAQTYAAQSRYAPPGAVSDQDCVRAQRNRQVAGAVIGGILGAVVGAELHDEAQDDARRDRRHYRGGRYYRGRGHYRGRYGRRHHRHRYEEGNDGAVLAGGALGAAAGAALAGRSDCDRRTRTGYGYGAAPGHYGHDRRRAASEPIYDEYGRPYDAGYGHEDRSAYGPRSSGELLGGEDYQRETRPYAARSALAGPSRADATGPCREMRSGNGALVLMCRGPDGIWRPA